MEETFREGIRIRRRGRGEEEEEEELVVVVASFSKLTERGSFFRDFHQCICR